MTTQEEIETLKTLIQFDRELFAAGYMSLDDLRDGVIQKQIEIQYLQESPKR